MLNAIVTAAGGRSGGRVHLLVREPEGERTVEGSDLLAAVGRVSVTREVGLSSAGIELDTRGFIRVNDRLETTALSYNEPGWLAKRHGLGSDVGATVSAMAASLNAVAKDATGSP